MWCARPHCSNIGREERGIRGIPHIHKHPLTPLEGGSQERVNSAPTLLNTLPDITPWD